MSGTISEIANLVKLDESARLARGRELVENLGTRFDGATCSALVEALGRIGERDLQAWLDGLPPTANAAWLRTQLLTDDAALDSAWQMFFSFHPRRQPLDILAWSRVLADRGRGNEAAQQLRLALSQGVGYTFFTRSEKLVGDLAASPQPNARRCRIAVLGSSTTTFLLPVMRALCFRDRIAAEFYEAPFGSIEQEIWNEKSGLAEFRPGIVMLLVHWRDLALQTVTAESHITSLIERWTAQWNRLTDRLACHIIQPAFDYPAHEPYGHLAGTLAGGRTHVIDTLNLRLREAAPSNVSVMDLAAVQREVGIQNWQNDLAWMRYRQHPSVEALPQLAESYMSLIRASLGLSRKVLVTDLDNTLWGGIVGEDGLEGIKIGPDSHDGEAYLALQQYMVELRRKGILLAVCSKNNPDDARLPFLQHPHMALKMDDFAAFRANWEDKVINLRALAQELSLGLDSFVFLDDNPVECEWVRSQLPEVAVVEVDNPPLNVLRHLDRARYFETLSLSSEDLVRADQYRIEAQRKSLLSASGSFEDFLRDLQMEAAAEEVTPANLARVTQLVNKTNQFNLTTRRYTEAQIRQMAEDPDCWIRAFRLSDRMGSYGLVGVLICKPANSPDTWEIDTWLMSCRVLGREMERFMFDRMIEAASARSIHHIEAVYLPTPKNHIVSTLYDELGFTRLSEYPGIRYQLTLTNPARVAATQIRQTATSARPHLPLQAV